jgi:hypothetical protein
MRRKWIFIAPLGILAMALFAFIGGEVVKLLWNWLLPPLFGWRALTFWQALGLLALCRILFGGLGPGGGPRSHVGRNIRQRMEERRERMTPEERERFRERMRDCFGFNTPPGESTDRPR